MKKKFGKLMFTSLLLGGLIIPVSGCVKPNEPFVPPESSDKVLINDAYDWNEDETGSTRPELGGGYVPVPPAKEAVVTIAEGSKIKFKDNAKSVTLPVGELLTNESFDADSLDGNKVGGIAVLDEEGNIESAVKLNDFLPLGDVTVIPYYTLDKGEDMLIGSGLLGDYIFDGEFNDISGDISITSKAYVSEGWLGNRIDVEGTLAQDSLFRALTPMTINEGYTYNYSYKFTNYCDSEISFTVYQMYSGYRWDNPATSVTVETITLAAGATSEIVSAEVGDSVANENIITVIKADAEIENLSLGVAMAVEDITVKGPAEITLKLPEGVTVDESYETNVTTFEKLVLPTDEQVQVSEECGMGEIVGWFDVATGRIVNSNTTVIRSMTIAPYWRNMAGYNYIGIGSGANSGYNTDEVPGDIVKHISGTGSVSLQGKSSPAVVSGGDGYSVLGAVLSDSMPVNAGSAIRFDSSRSAGAGIYEFNMTFANYGTSTLHLSVYHINASSDYKVGGGWYNYETTRHRVDIQIAPGESVTKLGQYDLASNGNWLTYIVFEEDVDSFSFGIAESYKAVEEYDSENYPIGNLLDKNVTIAYDQEANGGITVDSAYLTKRVGRFIVAPAEGEYTVPEDVIFMGWKLVIYGKEYDLPARRVNYTDLQVPSSNVELKAVFSKVTTTPVNIALANIEGFTVSEEYLNKVQYVGGYFSLPAEGEYTNETGAPLLGWRDKTTGEALTDGMIINVENLVLEPILAAKVNITAAEVDGFTLSQSYLDKAQYLTNTFILPTEAEYTNTTGLPLVGWRDATTGTVLTADTVLELENIVLEPIMAETTEVTLVLPEGLTVEGFNYNQAKDLALTLPADSMITDTTGMGVPYGWYNVATKAVVTSSTLVTEGLTIAPYWQTVGGYDYVQVGSGVNSGYNTDEVPGDIGKHSSSITYQGKTTVGGSAVLVKSENYYLLGSVLSDSLPVQAGSAIRFDSARSGGSGIYEFSYTIENKGSSKLHLSIYQINASSDYKAAGSYYRYETTRYRTNIEVEAGASAVAIGQYNFTNETNTNWVTYIVFEEDVQSFSFGIAIGVKAVEAYDSETYPIGNLLDKTVTLVYDREANGGIVVKDSYLVQRVGRFAVAPTADDLELPEGTVIRGWQLVIGETTYDLPASTSSYTDIQIPSSGATLKVILQTEVEVTLQNNNGVNIEGAKTVYKTGEKLVLPELSETTTDGRTHAGWFNAATGEIVTNDTTVNGAMTIAPYFTAAGTALTPLSGASASEKGCAYGPDNCSSTALEGNFEKITNVIGGDEAGIILNYNGTLASGDAFRFKTTYSVQAKTYKYTIRFTNYSDSEISFTVYQIRGTTDTAGMPKQEVTLAAGESITVELTISYTGTNGNALTYFEMGGSIENMSLGVSMSVAEAVVEE